MLTKNELCQWLVTGSFLRVLRFPPPIKLTATSGRYNWNIVESGVKHYEPKPKPEEWIFRFFLHIALSFDLGLLLLCCLMQYNNTIFLKNDYSKWWNFKSVIFPILFTFHTDHNCILLQNLFLFFMSLYIIGIKQ
jgi:hypothetical protein